MRPSGLRWIIGLAGVIACGCGRDNPPAPEPKAVRPVVDSPAVSEKSPAPKQPADGLARAILSLPELAPHFDSSDPPVCLFRCVGEPRITNRNSRAGGGEELRVELEVEIRSSANRPPVRALAWYDVVVDSAGVPLRARRAGVLDPDTALLQRLASQP